MSKGFLSNNDSLKMSNKLNESGELLDQAVRQTMLFDGMPAALETDTGQRKIKIIMLVDQWISQAPMRWYIERNSGLGRQFSPVARPAGFVEGDIRRALSIAASVEKAFSGIKLTL